MGQVLIKLRNRLDESGLEDKQIGITLRWNAFWKTPQTGGVAQPSDGEAVDLDAAMKSRGSSLNDTINWFNIMAYDDSAAAYGRDTFDLELYQKVLEYAGKILEKNKIVMGFEPGKQQNNAIWEGVDVDQEAITYVKENGYGGVFFWAINDRLEENGVLLGQNAQRMAAYAATGTLPDIKPLPQVPYFKLQVSNTGAADHKNASITLKVNGAYYLFGSKYHKSLPGGYHEIWGTTKTAADADTTESAELNAIFSAGQLSFTADIVGNVYDSWETPLDQPTSQVNGPTQTFEAGEKYNIMFNPNTGAFDVSKM